MSNRRARIFGSSGISQAFTMLLSQFISLMNEVIE